LLGPCREGYSLLPTSKKSILKDQKKDPKEMYMKRKDPLVNPEKKDQIKVEDQVKRKI